MTVFCPLSLQNPISNNKIKFMMTKVQSLIDDVMMTILGLKITKYVNIYKLHIHCYSSINKNIFINAIYYCLADLSLLSWLSPSYLTLMLQPISLSWWACRAHWQSISPSSTLSMHMLS